MDVTWPPTAASSLDQGGASLLALLRHLDAIGYDFVTPTPATHARVVARLGRAQARSLEDVLGWSLPFTPGALDPEMERCLRLAGALQTDGGEAKSALRASRLHDRLFLHSAFPTDATDAVFFGPDSYRFADLVRAELASMSPASRPFIVDIGAGAGVGAIIAGELIPQARLVMTDTNPEALRLARINAEAAGITADTLLAADLDAIDRPIDIAIANPPYLLDDLSRSYRHGGGEHGSATSIAFAADAARHLAPGGRLILYTGSAIVAGRDLLRQALHQTAQQFGCAMRYRELDPDVFGEELDRPQYQDVDRIAAVAAVIQKPG